MDKRKTILIVDDEKELVGLVSLHMNMSGFGILTAYDGKEALEACVSKCPDLVVLDLMMPKIDGIEVCRILKNRPDTRAIPIVILSALSDTEEKLKAFGVGADDYVTKPFSPRELSIRVRKILEREEVKKSAGTIV